ncbi:rhodanese-like domain-containing protein [secondary endosymbiont of Ctenarytaina eucalypti]|uniref:Rhodanese-related sulfurtransferase n=1 Tax=secondary endosymbiont of Ctenarytaina eucalypti TaxID=1199245 RepID=J3TF27_9ENTR|nr:rhodanese-like domain-containing protein [secondary endosymbiont of Ctenarytaina eucalypti]AFP84627.1 Rhodanese-related sulfurtransferase [secondary endosymbiont of Ctenarytaina eucalypti]
MQDIMQFVGNHSILSLIWVILFGAVIFTTIQHWFSKVDDITCASAVRLINAEDAVMIDVRNRDDYCKGHITNSLNISADDIKFGNLGALEKAKGRPVIVVSSSGFTVRDPAKNLIKAGFERVYVLKGGISGWNREHLPLIRGR